jgi:hypothetical protein
MDSKDYGVHIEHCCKKHGCKYGNKDCPVINGIAEQKYPCESCDYEKEFLKNYSIKDLQDEIDRRNEEKNKIPDFLSDEEIMLKLPVVKKRLREELGKINEGWFDTDFEDYCYETFLDMFYGDKIWDWINDDI